MSPTTPLYPSACSSIQVTFFRLLAWPVRCPLLAVTLFFSVSFATGAAAVSPEKCAISVK